MTPYRDRLNAGHYDVSWTDEATVNDLKEALAAKGLPTSGTKAELQRRLREAS